MGILGEGDALTAKADTRRFSAVKGEARNSKARPAMPNTFGPHSTQAGSSAYIQHMDTESALAPVVKIALQRFLDGSKSDLVPWDFGLGEQSGLDGFMAGIEVGAQQSGAVIQVDLANVDYIHDAEQILQFILCACFLVGLAGCAFCRGFAHFHEAGWQGPLAPARLDVAFAQQHLSAVLTPHGHRANDVQGIFIMHSVASRADGPLPGVTVIGQAVNHGGTADAAVFQRGTMHQTSVAALA